MVKPRTHTRKSNQIPIIRRKISCQIRQVINQDNWRIFFIIIILLYRKKVMRKKIVREIAEEVGLAVLRAQILHSGRACRLRKFLPIVIEQ